MAEPDDQDQPTETKFREEVPEILSADPPEEDLATYPLRNLGFASSKHKPRPGGKLEALLKRDPATLTRVEQHTLARFKGRWKAREKRDIKNAAKEARAKEHRIKALTEPDILLHKVRVDQSVMQWYVVIPETKEKLYLDLRNPYLRWHTQQVDGGPKTTNFFGKPNGVKTYLDVTDEAPPLKERTRKPKEPWQPRQPWAREDAPSSSSSPGEAPTPDQNTPPDPDAD